MDTKHWSDIGYNFIVGEDGNVYEGRGWGKQGAHSKNFNNKSIGICIIGDYTSKLYAKKYKLICVTTTLYFPISYEIIIFFISLYLFSLFILHIHYFLI